MGQAMGLGHGFSKKSPQKIWDRQNNKNVEASGLRGSIRLVKVALTNEFSGQTDPRGPETDQNRPKSPKTDQKPGGPLAPISLKAGSMYHTPTLFMV